MQLTQSLDYTTEIEDAIRKAKCKKVLYLYDEAGNREMLGVFSKNKAAEIKKYFQNKKLLDRLTEFEVKTTEPDSVFKY